MNKLLITTLILMGIFVGSSSVARAQQDIPDNPNTQAPTTNTDQGLSWWWILPLLAIPLLFLLRRNNREEDTSSYRGQSMAGSKGGEAKSNREDETL